MFATIAKDKNCRSENGYRREHMREDDDDNEVEGLKRFHRKMHDFQNGVLIDSEGAT